MKANRDAGHRSVGWFGSVFNTCKGMDPGVRTTFAQERRRSLELLRETARHAGVTLPKETLHTVLDDDLVEIGGVSWRVGLAAQYLELK